MSPPRDPRLPPSPATHAATKDGYRASFYPGFVSSLTVTAAGGTPVVLFQQPADEPFVLPPGAEEPYTSSVVEISGGPQQRRVSLHVDDPRREIAAIVLYLKPPDWRARPPAAPPAVPPPTGAGEEVYVILDTPILCPPICRDGEPGAGPQ